MLTRSPMGRLVPKRGSENLEKGVDQRPEGRSALSTSGDAVLTGKLRGTNRGFYDAGKKREAAPGCESSYQPAPDHLQLRRVSESNL